jgi:type II secretion system protein G
MVKKGFTLIELLVVIAIIGLLSTLTVLALNSARARVRDAKRVADVKQIKTALEMYYSDNNDYPASLGTSITSTNGTYLQSVPVAPTPADGNCTTTSNTYSYTYRAGTPASYTLNYCLGGAVNGIPGGSLQTATPAGMK